MRIGDVRIDPLVDGELALPGPSFYPGTTEADWLAYREFLEPVDHQPVHLCSLGGYLLRWDAKVVVVDCGIGPIPTAPFRAAASGPRSRALGVARADVTDVIFSRLHFDHIGWATLDGKPFFPNATYRVDRRTGTSTAPGARCRTSRRGSATPRWTRRRPAWLPVADRMEFFQGEVEVIPGINAYEASGHTPGETVLEIRSAGERGLLLGDLVHAQPELVDEDAAGKWQFVPLPHAGPGQRGRRTVPEDDRRRAAAVRGGPLRGAALGPDRG